MGQIVTYLLMVQKFKNLKQKIVATPLSLGNISKDMLIDNMKNGYDFSVDYNATDVDNIKDIHKYSMKKNNMV